MFTKPETVKKKEDRVNKDLANSIGEIIKNIPKLTKNKVEDKPVVKKVEEPVVEPDEIESSVEAPVEPEPVVSDIISSYKKSISDDKKKELPEPEDKTLETNEAENSDKLTSGYVQNLKDTEDPSEVVSNKINTPDINSNYDFFKFLETHKEDPRLVKIFNGYSEKTKKELFSITEKYEKEFRLKLGHAMESGGAGSSTIRDVQGNLKISGDLIVDGTITGQNLGQNTGNVTKLSFDITNNNTFTIQHNLNSKEIIVNVYDSNAEKVICYIKNISLNETLISFSEVVTDFKVVIIG